jgi:hypothetical protein
MVTRKKIKPAGAIKKKSGIPAKGRSKPKAKEDVCVMDEVLVKEQGLCCDYWCC